MINITTRFKHIFLLVFMMITSFSAFAQGDNSVKGFVYEKSNGEPVMFANVFLKGTTMGATTDINGYFSITRIPDGDYMIMVTSVGYDTISENLSLKGSQILNKKYYIQEASIQLAAVSITADKIEARTETKTSVVNITPKTIKTSGSTQLIKAVSYYSFF